VTAWDIRPMLAEDFRELMTLWSATEGLGVGPGDTPEAIATFLDRNPEMSLVGLSDGAIVASILCGHDGRRGFIYRLAVSPAHRRRGLAAELVRRCVAGLAAAGIPRCQIFVEADNEAARDFWAAMGGALRNDLVVFSIEVP